MSSDRKAYMKEYMKKWRENNKEHMQEQKKEYRENNKEHIQKYDKEYRKNNKEYLKAYRQTEACIKSRRIRKWKSYEGMSLDYDFNIIYDIYISTDFCDYCNTPLIEGQFGGNKKCLDHNHKTGEIRGIICHRCNVRDVFRDF